MKTVLDTLFRYRLAAARCDAGAELDLDEMQTLFVAERDFRLVPVSYKALLVGNNDHCSDIIVGSIGTLGVVLYECCKYEVGTILELSMEDDSNSYRFKIQLAWSRDGRNGKQEAGFVFVGSPLLVRRGPPSAIMV